MTSEVIARGLDWVSAEAPLLNMQVKAKTRYRQADQACTILQIDDSSVRVSFAQPQRAITPGQALVLYQNRICLGGGTIEASH